MPSINGKFSLVLGGTSGVGAATCIALAAANCSVSIVGRNEARGDEVLQQCKAASPHLPHEFLTLDFSSIEAVKQFGAAFQSSHAQLDFLIHSAGGQTTGTRTETAEGIDLRMATNVYSRFVLTSELVSMLEKSEAPRVISVCNPGAGKIVAKDDLDLKTHYSYNNWNAAASLYNDLLFDEFSIRHPRVSFVHVFPGVLATRNKNTGPWWIRLTLGIAYPFLKDGASFAGKMLTILSDERFNANGRVHMLDNTLKAKPRVPDHTDENRDMLWQHLLSITSSNIS